MRIAIDPRRQLQDKIEERRRVIDYERLVMWQIII